jgi:hypothetical protein
MLFMIYGKPENMRIQEKNQNCFLYAQKQAIDIINNIAKILQLYSNIESNPKNL